MLSDGVHMNSYFFLCTKLNDLITKKQVKYGTIMRIDKYIFKDGENCTDHSPRWQQLLNVNLSFYNAFYFQMDNIYSTGNSFDP